MDEVFYLGSHTMLLMAGTVQHHRRLWDETMGAAKGAFRSADHAAILYRSMYSLYRREVAAARYLEPLGLTLKAFTERQKRMDAVHVETLSRLLRDCNLGVAAIIAGVERTSGHPRVWTVSDPGERLPQHTTGVIAIGSGAAAALSQFRNEGYGRAFARARTLRLVLAAKKYAERAVGVGTATDLWEIRADNGVTKLPRAHVEALEALHEGTLGAIRQAQTRADREVAAFLRRGKRGVTRPGRRR